MHLAAGVVLQNREDFTFFSQRRILSPAVPHLITPGSGVNLRQFAVTLVPCQPIRFLLVARLLAEKGVREFVAAAQILRSRHAGCRFRLVGPFERHPGAIRPFEVQHWVDEGLIEFTGWVDEVYPHLAEASVFVLPSYYREGVPRSVLEAMAVGRPIITTDAPGCRETVQSGVNGFLIPPRDVGGLVQAMEKFVVRPELLQAMGTASRTLAEQRFDVRQVNASLIEFMALRPSATVRLPT
ncbi:MAG: glycosyltransferase family 4 protein [Verrucomicrobiota bacterium]